MLRDTPILASQVFTLNRSSYQAPRKTHRTCPGIFAPVFEPILNQAFLSFFQGHPRVALNSI